MTSTDAINWSLAPAIRGQVDTYGGIAYGNGVWVVINSDGPPYGFYSTDDLQTWNSCSGFNSGNGLADITFANGKFIAITGGSGQVFTSSDGINFQVVSTPAPERTWQQITHGNDNFVAVSNNGTDNRVMYSGTGTGVDGYNSTLTLAGTDNLDLFTAGDAIAMVDSDGDVASYTPVTSTISDVDNTTPNYTNEGYPSMGYWDASQVRKYTFNPPISVLELKTDNLGTGLYGRVLSTWYNGNIYQSGNPEPGTITGTAYNSGQIWNASFNNNSGGNGAQNAVGKEYKITFETAWLMDTIYVVQRLGNGNDWSADSVSINGERLTNISNPPLLTFTSPNPDLKFFNPGDVVQQSNKTITGQALIDNSTLFINNDGANSTDAAGLYTSVTSSYVQLRAYYAGINFTAPFVVNSKLRIYVAAESGGDFYLNGPVSPTDTTAGIFGGNAPSYISGSQGWVDVTANIPSFPFYLDRIGCKNVDGGAYFRWYGIEIDNVVIITSTSGTVFDSIKVISTDTTTNTMTVDGGTWEGTDGSNNEGYVTFTGTNTSGDSLAYRLAGDLISIPESNSNLTGCKERIAINQAGTLSLNFNASFSNATYVITSSNGLTTSMPTSGTIVQATNVIYTFTSTGPGAYFDITYSFATNGSVSHYSVSGGTNNNTSDFDGNTLYYSSNLGPVNVSINPTATPETIVTAPAKSGTGNFSDNTGAVVDVSNSNQQWISNDNRLSTNFFIKPASTQVGMGALRTQAIAASAAWSSSTNYASLGLVQHNGRYWAAISSNSNVTPETASAATWVDLGAI